MPSQPSKQEQQGSGISLLTLMIASASSVVAAIVVSRIWGPGTLIGAAATPVIVTLVSEALRKPAEKVTVIRMTPSGTQVHEAAPGQPRPRAGAADVSEEPTMVAGPEVPVRRRSRPALAVALATGLVAFAIGAFVLTGTELVFGDAASGGGGTTYFNRGDGAGSRATPQEEEPPARTTSTETQTTTTGTETVPAPAPAAPADPEAGPEAVPPTQVAPPADGTTGATGAT
ncbi:MAG: Fe-S oxidoreductase, partial [Solirubrobacterales bacterium]|nr:Fe-S oxidoreductase [Solirubrobacterales bacterium]